MNTNVNPVDDFIVGDLSTVPVILEPYDLSKTLELIDSISLEDALSALAVSFPAAIGRGRSVNAQARIPEDWAVTIEKMRDRVGTRLPKQIWPTTGEFYRWCIGIGISVAGKLDIMLNNSDPSVSGPKNAITEAQLFVERIGGEIRAKSKLIDDIELVLKDLAASANQMIRFGELAEAANIITRWIDGTRGIFSDNQTDPFWRMYVIKRLCLSSVTAPTLLILINAGQINDDLILSYIDDITDIVTKDQGSIKEGDDNDNANNI